MYLYVYVLKESIIIQNEKAKKKKELKVKMSMGHMFQQKKVLKKEVSSQTSVYRNVNSSESEKAFFLLY
jgi:hypothetical protein